MADIRSGIPGLLSPASLAADIGRRAREARLARAMRVEDLAAASGVPARTLRRFEAGGAATVETMVRVAVALQAEEPLRQLFPETPGRTLEDLVRPAPKRRRGRRAS